MGFNFIFILGGPNKNVGPKMKLDPQKDYKNWTPISLIFIVFRYETPS